MGVFCSVLLLRDGGMEGLWFVVCTERSGFL